MKKTEKKVGLRIKRLGGYIIFGLSAFLLASLACSRLISRAIERSVVEKLYEAVCQLTEDQDFRGGKVLVDAGMKYTGFGCRILYLDEERTVLFDSSENSSLVGAVCSDFLPAVSTRYWRTGEFDGIFGEPVLSVFVPITKNLAMQGYLTMHCPRALISDFEKEVLFPVLILIDALVIIGLLAFYFSQRRSLSPLRTILTGVQAFSTGDLGHRIIVRSKDEFGELADRLNKLADILQESESYQKKFIANVSHDFRSPLTSIRGYLEAMLDGVIPQDSQSQYMHLIIDEADRLTNMTKEMLKLSSLENTHMKVNARDFDIVELSRACCRIFESQCKPRGIRFELSYTSPTLFVYADEEKIRQVLQNLIDNGIKFSPDDSVLRIELYETSYKKVRVTVADEGVGISKEELSRIWNRFYKVDSSRGENKTGNGLGLAIVKEIIVAHNETIAAYSEPGQGARFVFRLPKGHRPSKSISGKAR